MLLRVSGEALGTAPDLSAVTEGRKGGPTGVRAGEELVAFTEAAVAGEEAEIAPARDALRAALGDAAVVDAAAVVGNFERMVRIADGTGIPLDAPMRLVSGEIREELGIDAFPAHAHTPGEGAVGRLLGGVLGRVGIRTLGRVARLSGRRSRS